uniref:Chemokine ligand 27a n=1 Tax=Ctenopharyngodon idella TaxID=7959 RepID=A0A345D703_CTEID|nr:chemokine ligand 27a [Ctenopharyngodon idella]
MKLKATSLLLLMCVDIIILTSNEAGAIPSCCLNVSKNIPQDILRAVTKYEMQSKAGRCEIDALILHARNKKKLICAHPRLLKIMKRLKKNYKPKLA